MRKYQTSRDAEAMASLRAQAEPSRDRFERYLVQLAAEQEQQLRVMDEEAQRCRALVTAPKTAGKKK
jgi:cation transport regulator ChaC